MQEENLKRSRLIITLSISLLFISVYLVITKEQLNKNTINNFVFETFNIKNISTAKIAYKNGVNSKNDTNDKLLKENNTQGQFINYNKEENASSAQQLNNTTIKWQLPTKTGTISQYPNYYHVALDITSKNGIYETIYPVAPGIITGIYTDSAGAKVITLKHYLNGTSYTSQYVHLSSYANGLYIGKHLNTTDALGQMGSTGIATGVHLHVTVIDCVLFDQSDPYCSDLNNFFKYLKVRYNQGFKGLTDLINVPNNW